MRFLNRIVILSVIYASEMSKDNSDFDTAHSEIPSSVGIVQLFEKFSAKHPKYSEFPSSTVKSFLSLNPTFQKFAEISYEKLIKELTEKQAFFFTENRRLIYAQFPEQSGA